MNGTNMVYINALDELSRMRVKDLYLALAHRITASAVEKEELPREYGRSSPGAPEDKYQPLAAFTAAGRK